jgi:hypothetical protein
VESISPRDLNPDPKCSQQLLASGLKLIDMDPNKPNMAKGFFVDRAIDDAAFILERIDARWPTIVNLFSTRGS